MLEAKEYRSVELFEILGTNNKQSTDRKLNNYQIQYTSSGSGSKLTYQILGIPDPFKVYCVFHLGINPRADFIKIRNLYYFFFCCDGFAEMPLIEQEKCLADNNKPVSRQTITKWINYLDHLDFISISSAEFNYYAIQKDNHGIKTYREIEKEQYSNAWKIYWNTKEECIKNGEQYPSVIAYGAMWRYLGGHPYKKPIIHQNAVLKAEIDYLIGLINEASLNDPSIQF